MNKEIEHLSKDVTLASIGHLAIDSGALILGDNYVSDGRITDEEILDAGRSQEKEFHKNRSKIAKGEYVVDYKLKNHEAFSVRFPGGDGMYEVKILCDKGQPQNLIIDLVSGGLGGLQEYIKENDRIELEEGAKRRSNKNKIKDEKEIEGACKAAYDYTFQMIDDIRKQAKKKKVKLDDRHLYAILDAVTLELASKYKTTFVKKVHSDSLKHALEAIGEK